MPSAKKELSKCLQVYTASGKTDAALSWSIQINTIVELGFFWQQYFDQYLLIYSMNSVRLDTKTNVKKLGCLLKLDIL